MLVAVYNTSSIDDYKQNSINDSTVQERDPIDYAKRGNSAGTEL